jgi:Pyruvate/2-oxoacid:ferredoxin oxidoreductase delta subunit
MVILDPDPSREEGPPGLHSFDVYRFRESGEQSSRREEGENHYQVLTFHEKLIKPLRILSPKHEYCNVIISASLCFVVSPDSRHNLSGAHIYIDQNKINYEFCFWCLTVAKT